MAAVFNYEVIRFACAGGTDRENINKLNPIQIVSEINILVVCCIRELLYQ